MTTNLEDRFVGCLLGSAVGDAIGEMAVRHPQRGDLHTAVARTETLIYTDDTAMSLGVASSLVENGGLEQERMAETLRSNFEREPWRGYGAGPPAIFEAMERGLDFREVAGDLFGGAGSFGNGAAMRMHPVGLFYHDHPELYEVVAHAAAITHTHAAGIDGAAVMAHGVAAVLHAAPESTLAGPALARRLAAVTRTTEFRNRLEQVARLLEDQASLAEAARELGTDVRAVHSVPYALFAFLRHHDSFTTCLDAAVLAGGDRDTLGAMACALAGAYHGAQGIPSPWREKLENRYQIEELAARLYALRP